jgi:hypothetical protein
MGTLLVYVLPDIGSGPDSQAPQALFPGGNESLSCRIRSSAGEKVKYDFGIIFLIRRK